MQSVKQCFVNNLWIFRPKHEGDTQISAEISTTAIKKIKFIKEIILEMSRKD